MAYLEQTKFDAMKEKGLKMHYCSMKKDELLYLPTGWLVFERVKEGALTYGIRKSFFLKTESARANYVMSKQLLAKQGADIANMELISDQMKESGGD